MTIHDFIEILLVRHRTHIACDREEFDIVGVAQECAAFVLVIFGHAYLNAVEHGTHNLVVDDCEFQCKCVADFVGDEAAYIIREDGGKHRFFGLSCILG